ncbi:MAG: hypothetical protein DCC68_04790 [Planctomycetota bacterium]|nr:MAG: hypothetical protein DCC68_04790 [Planctomycetota bacterium]
MTPIPLDLPASARVLFNSLFSTHEPSLLEQGLVSIVLDNGRHIDVSWHPEHESSGCYYLTVYGESWAETIHSATFDNAESVAAAVARAARDFSDSTPLTTIAPSELPVEQSTRANH